MANRCKCGHSINDHNMNKAITNMADECCLNAICSCLEFSTKGLMAVPRRFDPPPDPQFQLTYELKIKHLCQLLAEARKSMTCDCTEDRLCLASRSGDALIEYGFPGLKEWSDED